MVFQQTIVLVNYTVRNLKKAMKLSSKKVLHGSLVLGTNFRLQAFSHRKISFLVKGREKQRKLTVSHCSIGMGHTTVTYTNALLPDRISITLLGQ